MHKSYVSNFFMCTISIKCNTIDQVHIFEAELLCWYPCWSTHVHLKHAITFIFIFVQMFLYSSLSFKRVSDEKNLFLCCQEYHSDLS